MLKNGALREIYGRQGDAVAGDRQKLSSGFYFSPDINDVLCLLDRASL